MEHLAPNSKRIWERCTIVSCRLALAHGCPGPRQAHSPQRARAHAHTSTCTPVRTFSHIPTHTHVHSHTHTSPSVHTTRAIRTHRSEGHGLSLQLSGQVTPDPPGAIPALALFDPQILPSPHPTPSYKEHLAMPGPCSAVLTEPRGVGSRGLGPSEHLLRGPAAAAPASK